MSWAAVARLKPTEITSSNREAIATARGPPTAMHQRAARCAGFEGVAVRGFCRKPLSIVRQVLRGMEVDTREVADIGFVGSNVLELIVTTSAAATVLDMIAQCKSMSIIPDYDPLSPSLRRQEGRQPSEQALSSLRRRLTFQESRAKGPVIRTTAAQAATQQTTTPDTDVNMKGEIDIDSDSDSSVHLPSTPPKQLGHSDNIDLAPATPSGCISQ
ncbi:hypothetical protein RI367_003852 [Sorochytrium milnesiophthora]